MNIATSIHKIEIGHHKLSEEATRQLEDLATGYNAARGGHRVDTYELEPNQTKHSMLLGEIQHIRDTIGSGIHALIVEQFAPFSVGDFKSSVWAFATAMGHPMVQNHEGHKIIEVYDRGQKTIEDGARYHQTKQGAYVHNDGVSDPLPIDYLILACGQKALLGGESILIDASGVYVALSAYPEVLAELQADFWFENRGMSDEVELFQAPILSLDNNGIPLIRYFRVYIESAHQKAGVPLTVAQIEAMDFLDTVLDQAFVQRRVLLEPGQMLISADDKFLHTSTNFLDRQTPHTTIRDESLLKDLNRYMLRVLLRKN